MRVGRARQRCMRLILLLSLFAACGGSPGSEPASSSCLPDWSWCVTGELDGGARVIGAP